MVEKTQTEDENQTEPVIFNIPILWILRNAQQEHGLRHRDFQRYRQFITRKIRRMRKVLDFRQGNRAKVTPKQLDSFEFQDPRFVTLRIFEVERCWAYAMQLKEESQEDPRKRFHARNKMRKAVKHAATLIQLLDTYKFEPSSRLEIQAYVKWINAVLHFELQEWKTAKELFDAAHAIYTGLSKSADDDFRELYQGRVEELLPQIRYCAYNIGDKSAAKASDLRKLLTSDETNEDLQILIDQARSKEAEKVTEITWMNQKIPVKIEQARLAVLSLQEFDSELKAVSSNPEAVLNLYESILKTCVDGITAVREAIKGMDLAQSQAVGASTGDASTIAASKRQAQTSVGTISADKMSRTQLLLSFLQYAKFEKTVGRTLLQISNALKNSQAKVPGSVKDGILGTSNYPKTQELARLYDTITQNLGEILALPGKMDNSGELVTALKVRMQTYKTFRCFYLALAHGENKKFQECLALLKRTGKYVDSVTASLTEVESEIQAGKMAKDLEQFANVSFGRLSKEIKLLGEQVSHEELACRAQKMLFLASGTKTVERDDSKLFEKPLFETLDKFYDRASMEKKLMCTPNNQPLVSMPLDSLPLPVKTTFFDLALNHVEYPSYQERVRKTVEQQNVDTGNNVQQQSQGGISGFVKGWIWGGKK